MNMAIARCNDNGGLVGSKENLLGVRHFHLSCADASDKWPKGLGLNNLFQRSYSHNARLHCCAMAVNAPVTTQINITQLQCFSPAYSRLFYLFVPTSS